MDGQAALASLLDKIAAKKAAKGLPIPVVQPPLPPTIFQKPAQKTPGEIENVRSKEFELWKTWKTNGMQPEHLEPLLKSLDPIVQKGMNRYRNLEIPQKALEFKHRKLVIDALKSYDPAKGAGIHTHVTYALKQTDRFIKKHQNFARIPENVSRHIGAYDASKAELTDKLGHEPDDLSLAEHSGLSLKMIKTINKSRRKGLIESGGENDVNLARSTHDREMEVALLIYPQLTPEERRVHELSVGLNGNPKLKPGEIAKRLGFDGSKVSKLRRSIVEKMQPYLE